MNKVKNRFKEGMRINVNAGNVFSARQIPDWVEGNVEEILDTQFTVRTLDGRISFRSYGDKGRTWDFDGG